MVILMAGVIFTEPDVNVDADTDAEMMLNWEIRLLSSLLKKVNDERWTNKWWTTLEASAISAAKTDVVADADADADAAAELSNQ